MADKMWGGEPFWGLGYEWDPEWVLTDRQRGLRDTLIELCEKEMRANAKISDDELKFPRRGSNWPRLPVPADAAAWKRDVALLREEHRLLRAVIARFPPSRLGARGWRSRWSNAAHIYGIASHDLYHAGQIQLLNVLRRRP